MADRMNGEDTSGPTVINEPDPDEGEGVQKKFIDGMIAFSFDRKTCLPLVHEKWLIIISHKTIRVWEAY